MILTDTYGVTDVTGPIVCVTLAEKVAAVDRFGLTANVLDDWTVTVDPDLDGWVIRWNYLRLTIGDSLTDLTLAQAIDAERTRGRQHVDETAVVARRALGWGRGTPSVRCVVCRTLDVVTRQHAPGSRECRDTQAERRWDHAH